MLLVLYGNQEIGAQERTNFSYLIWSNPFERSRAVSIIDFFLRKDSFFHPFPSCSELPYNISTKRTEALILVAFLIKGIHRKINDIKLI